MHKFYSVGTLNCILVEEWPLIASCEQGGTKPNQVSCVQEKTIEVSLFMTLYPKNI